jgi:hypothetical protein
LLGVIDLAQVEDGALRGVTGAQPAVLDYAPVAMHLAVFFASVIAQKHVVGRQLRRIQESLCVQAAAHGVKQYERA